MFSLGIFLSLGERLVPYLARWALMGWALMGPMGHHGPGNCGPRWALMGQALVGPPGPLWPRPIWLPRALGPCGHPWTLAGRALAGPPGPLWAGPLWAPLGPCRARPLWPPWAFMGRAFMGRAPMGPPKINIYICTYLYVYINIYI